MHRIRAWVVFLLMGIFGAVAPGMAQGSSDYTHGVDVVGTTATIYFKSNVNTSWVDLHYTIVGNGPQNIRTTYNPGSGRFEKSTPVSVGNTILYSFTYTKDGLAFDTTQFSYKVGDDTVATPTFSPAGGTYRTAQSVSLATTTVGASIYYTLDGSTPSAASRTYSVPFTVDTTTQVRAIAIKGDKSSTIGSANYVISPVDLPVFSPAPGAFATAQTVTMSANGAAIYYTTDGSTPVPGSANTKTYVSGIALSTRTVLKAVAVKNGVTSEVVSGEYTFGNTYTQGVDVQGLTATIWLKSPSSLSFVDVHYTLAAGPQNVRMNYNAASARYEAPVALSAPCGFTLQYSFTAFFVGSGAVDTPMFSYTAPCEKVATPTCSPMGGTYNQAQTLTLSCATPGATLYYTLDGTTPTSNSKVYQGAITVSGSLVLKAIAVKAGLQNSDLFQAEFRIITKVETPVFSPLPGTYTSTQSVVLSTATANAVIYYTLDGTTPTSASTRYTGAIPVAQDTTIRAIAVLSGLSNSDEASGFFAIRKNTITIQTQPADQTVQVGSTATFQVVASIPVGTLTYQWSKNGNPIPGATAATYTTPATVKEDNGSTYSVLVSAEGATPVPSRFAALTVKTVITSTKYYLCPEMPIGVSPTGMSLGDTPSALHGFQPITTLSGTPTYWYAPAHGMSIPQGPWKVVLWSGSGPSSVQKVDLLLTGKDGSQPTVVATQTVDIQVLGGNHSTEINFGTLAGLQLVNQRLALRLTKLSGSDATIAFGVDFPSRIECPEGTYNPLVLSLQNLNVTVMEGQKAVFSAIAAGGSGTYTYQWACNGSTLTGESFSDFVLAKAVMADSGKSYTVTVKDTVTGEQLTSEKATLTVAPATILITKQPAETTVTKGAKATFIVVASSVSGKLLTYQWYKGRSLDAATLIPGATSASYTTPATTDEDNFSSYFVVISDGTWSVPSNPARLNLTPTFDYKIYPGLIGIEFKNPIGTWRDDQVFVSIQGRLHVDGNPNSQMLWVDPDGKTHAMSMDDNGALVKNGTPCSNYFFSLAQINQTPDKVFKMPKLDSVRIFVSMGEPLYIPIVRDGASGLPSPAYPNFQNPSDPNQGSIFEWWEATFDSTGPQAARLWINTTQVDQFGFPVLIETFGNSKGQSPNYAKTGVALSRKEVFESYPKMVPQEFRDLVVFDRDGNSRRIDAPCKGSFGVDSPGAGQYVKRIHGTYMDPYVDEVWNYYSQPGHVFVLNMYPDQNGVFTRRWEGRVVGGRFAFTEVDLHNGAYANLNPVLGDGGFLVPDPEFHTDRPSTQEVLEGKGFFDSGDTKTTLGIIRKAIAAQVCAGLNRHIMTPDAQGTTPDAMWGDPSKYYQASPTNWFAWFTHQISIDGKAYGFAYDDVMEQSSSLVSDAPEHLHLIINW